MAIKVIVESNLGDEFLLNQEVKKIELKVDGTTVTKAEDGTISATGGAVVTPAPELGVLVLDDAKTKVSNQYELGRIEGTDYLAVKLLPPRVFRTVNETQSGRLNREGFLVASEEGGRAELSFGIEEANFDVADSAVSAIVDTRRGDGSTYSATARYEALPYPRFVVDEGTRLTWDESDASAQSRLHLYRYGERIYPSGSSKGDEEFVAHWDAPPPPPPPPPTFTVVESDVRVTQVESDAVTVDSDGTVKLGGEYAHFLENGYTLVVEAVMQDDSKKQLTLESSGEEGKYIVPAGTVASASGREYSFGQLYVYMVKGEEKVEPKDFYPLTMYIMRGRR